MSNRLLLASNNSHKLEEFERMLRPLGIDVLAPRDLAIELEVAETGASFADNAMLKASAFAKLAEMATAADDSGLVVDALGGEPGIYSARYGGPGLSDADRTCLVIRRMNGVRSQGRTARFVAVIALVVPGQRPVLFEGIAEGLIAARPIGTHGFGYDPIFYYPPFGRTFGQAAPSEKDVVSHRAIALRDMVRYLRDTGADGILDPWSE